MAIFTFDPTPIEGGAFDHNSDRFDWCALTDTKFLIVYQQISPAKLFAQIVNFAGTTAAPTFGTAFVIDTSNINLMFPACTAMSASRAFVAINGNILNPINTSTATLKGISLNIDGSDVITVLDANTALTTAEFNRFDIGYHPTTVAPFRLRTLSESSSSVFTRLFSVDASGLITLSTQTTVFAGVNKGPMSLIPSPSTDSLLARIQDQEVGKYENPLSNTLTAIGSTTFDNMTAMAYLSENVIVGADLTTIRAIEHLGSPETSFLSVINSNTHHAIRLDDEHIAFASGQLTPGTMDVSIFRITNEGGFAFIANENNPLVISNGVINVQLIDGSSRQSMYHNSTNNLIHMTGIVDNVGTNVIGFHIFSPV